MVKSMDCQSLIRTISNSIGTVSSSKKRLESGFINDYLWMSFFEFYIFSFAHHLSIQLFYMRVRMRGSGCFLRFPRVTLAPEGRSSREAIGSTLRGVLQNLKTEFL